MSAADVGTSLAVGITASNSARSSVAFSNLSSPIVSTSSPFSITSTVQDGTAISGNVNWQATPSIAVNFVQFAIDGTRVQTVTGSPYTYNGSTTGHLDTATLTNGTHVLGIRALSSDNRTYGFYGATVTVGNGPKNVTSPAVSGNAVQGQVVSTSNGSWTNSPSSFSYQWYRCDSSGSNCSSIAGANGSSYGVTAADAGYTLRSAVTATNAGGSNTASSAATSPVPGSGSGGGGGGTGTGSGISLVQENAVHGSAVGSLSVSFPVNNQQGNLILAAVRMSTASQTVTITDSLGNTYTDAVNQAQTADGHQVHLFYARNIAAGANTITAAFSSTNNHPYLAIYEYSGLSTTNPLDQTAHAQGSSALADTGGTASTNSASELIFAATGLPASYSGVVTAGSGYALQQQDTSSERGATESAIATTTGSIHGIFNLNPGTSWSAVVATFRVAGSSGGAPPPPQPPPPTPPSGPISLVQSNAAYGSGTGSVSATFPVANQGRDLIIAVVRLSTTWQTVAIGDTAGNAYAEAASQMQTADGHQLHLFYAKNIAGAANTVTATFSSTNNHPWIAVFEYSGLNPANPLDQTMVAQGSGSSADSGATPMTTAPNELVFAAAGFPASYTGAVTAGTGYTRLLQDTTSERGATEATTTSSTGAFHGTFNLNPSAYWSAIVATFRP
jgi:hypothetical protein